MLLHKNEIEFLKEKINNLTLKLNSFEEQQINITPLMNNILNLIKNKALSSKEIYDKLNENGIKIHQKSIPRSIKSLIKISKIKKIENEKPVKYIAHDKE